MNETVVSIPGGRSRGLSCKRREVGGRSVCPKTNTIRQIDVRCLELEIVSESTKLSVAMPYMWSETIMTVDVVR